MIFTSLGNRDFEVDPPYTNRNGITFNKIRVGTYESPFRYDFCGIDSNENEILITEYDAPDLLCEARENRKTWGHMESLWRSIIK